MPEHKRPDSHAGDFHADHSHGNHSHADHSHADHPHAEHSHGHSAHHHHGHGHAGHSPLNAALILTSVFAVIEMLGGWISGSLALLADAVHMVSDVGALALAAIAQRIALRPAHAGMTYGYGRVRVLAAQANGLALLFVAGWIVWVAIERLQSPPQVQGGLMLAVAIAGLLVNVVILRWLHGGHDINTRAAYWHVVGDLLGSVSAVAAGLVILLTGWMPIDPLLSFVVALILVWGGWRLLRDTILQLMDAVPAGLDMQEIRRCMLAVDGVCDVHHVHLWLLPDGRAALSAHVRIDQMQAWPHILAELLSALQGAGVSHATLQAENDEVSCSDVDSSRSVGNAS